MNILLIGSGAREHAIAKCVTRSKQNTKLFCCATANNPGISELCTDYWLGDINQVAAIVTQAKNWNINLTIIGPEAPLEHGLADALWKENIPVIGPKKQLAQIETSKTFTRDLMQKYQISGLPKYKAFTSMNGIEAFLQELGEGNYVIKMDGLMAGKGVKVAGDHLHSIGEALMHCEEIIANKQSLLIEEKLIGQEFSFMCFSDGLNLVPMPLVQDNKRAFEGDKGPNTGGMGSFSAADHSLPFLIESDRTQAFAICQHVLSALAKETQDKYIGILYGGFIATARGVYVIEFNARFGDPEAMNVLSILQSDFVDLCLAMTQGHLHDNNAQFAYKATVCKYAVPEGYPDNPVRNVEIDIAALANNDGLYLAAVDKKQGKLYATGSRTAAFVGIADSIDAAEQAAEHAISAIKGPLFHRQDIGTTALINQRIQAMNKVRQL